MTHPLVSIIIVNFNAKDYLKQCLDAVYNNHYPNYEVIVVDNGSDDGSRELLQDYQSRYQHLQNIFLDKNMGPAYARNQAVHKANGKYLAFLDNDARPDPDWLFQPIEIMEKDKSVAACQCKLLLMNEPDRYDYGGEYISQLGFLVQRVLEGYVDDGKYDQQEEILAAKSAGMVLRKDVFEKVGGLDDDYFIYMEETDLGWRMWLAGYRVVFSPQSKVWHEFGTTALLHPKLGSYNAKFHGTKNYITTLIKNLEFFNMIKIATINTFCWLGLGGFLLIKQKWQEAFWLYKAIFWVVMNLPKIWQKRSQVNKIRKVSDKDIFPKIMRKRPFRYFLDKARGTESMGKAPNFID